MDVKYCYPGTDVLINKLNIRDSQTLEVAERDLSFKRLQQLQKNPIKGSFDMKHLQSIHKHIFQDLYSWAGEIRDVAIAKTNLFCLPQYIEPFGNDIFRNLKKANFFKGLEQEEFTKAFTTFAGDLNALHPFREGNGRSSREFLRQLAQNAGYKYDFSKITPEENIKASIDDINGNSQAFLNLMKKAISPLQQSNSSKKEKVAVME